MLLPYDPGPDDLAVFKVRHCDGRGLSDIRMRCQYVFDLHWEEVLANCRRLEAARKGTESTHFAASDDDVLYPTDDYHPQRVSRSSVLGSA